MHLNTLAGRSYNDLMQYPVFPWILADYDAEVRHLKHHPDGAERLQQALHHAFFCLFFNQELDLNNPKTFRNLAKPMGAQTDDRLTQYKKRFKDWEDPNGKTGHQPGEDRDRWLTDHLCVYDQKKTVKIRHKWF